MKKMTPAALPGEVPEDSPALPPAWVPSTSGGGHGASHYRVMPLLLGRSDAELAELMQARPDAVRVAPQTFTGWAQRLCTPDSVRRAIENLEPDAFMVARAVVALDTPDPQAIAAAVDEDPEAVAEHLKRLRFLALITDHGPVTSMLDYFAGAEPGPRPPAPNLEALQAREPALIAEESARSGGECVRLATKLLRSWQAGEGPEFLRRGGLGVRALKAVAAELEVPIDCASFLVDLLGDAGLLGSDRYGIRVRTSTLGEEWLEWPRGQRWSHLAMTWALSARCAWRVSAPAAVGADRLAILDRDLEHSAWRELRRRILTILLRLPGHRALTADWFLDYVRHASPSSRLNWDPAPLLAEASLLGITGAGALSEPGRILAQALAERSQRHAVDPTELGHALTEAFDAQAPDAVGLLLIQSDLTAIVPGPPEEALDALLERCATVESRSAALTVRFTPESVRGALESGMSAQSLTQALAQYSPSPLPSTLQALIEDASRRYGAVRVRPAGSILMVPDPALAAELLVDKALADAGLKELAPGILVTPPGVPAGYVMERLRASGRSPVAEAYDGSVAVERPFEHAEPTPEPSYPGDARATWDTPPSARRAPHLGQDFVARALAGMRQHEAERGAGEAAEGDPALASMALKAAMADHRPVRVRLATSQGGLEERTVLVLGVHDGRVRLADVDRETELTVALHRVAEVRDAPTAS